MYNQVLRKIKLQGLMESRGGGVILKRQACVGSALAMNRAALPSPAISSYCHVLVPLKEFPPEYLFGGPLLDEGIVVLFYKFKFLFMLYMIKLCIRIFHLMHCNGLNVCVPSNS